MDFAFLAQYFDFLVQTIPKTAITAMICPFPDKTDDKYSNNRSILSPGTLPGWGIPGNNSTLYESTDRLGYSTYFSPDFVEYRIPDWSKAS